MSRRMSCSMTRRSVEMRIKDVTRRDSKTWKNLKRGDRLTLIEKGMGLKKGERQRVLAEVEVVDVRVEPIWWIMREKHGTRHEGLPEMSPTQFIIFWLCSHGYMKPHDELTDELLYTPCRRIEWRYL